MSRAEAAAATVGSVCQCGQCDKSNQQRLFRQYQMNLLISVGIKPEEYINFAAEENYEGFSKKLFEDLIRVIEELVKSDRINQALNEEKQKLKVELIKARELLTDNLIAEEQQEKKSKSKKRRGKKKPTSVVEKENAGNHRSVDELQKRCDALSQQLAEYKEERAELAGQVENLAAERDKLTNTLNQVKLKLKTLQEKNSKAGKSQQQLHVRLKTAQEAHKKRETDLCQALRESKQKCHRLKKQFEQQAQEWQKKFKKVVEDFEQEQQAKQQLQAEQKALSVKHQQAQNKINKLKQRIQELEKQPAEQVDVQADSKLGKCDDRQKMIFFSAARIAALRNLERAERTISSQARELESVTHRRLDDRWHYQVYINDLAEEKDQTEQALAAAEEKLSQLQAEANGEKIELIRLNHHLGEENLHLKEQIAFLQAQLKFLKRSYAVFLMDVYRGQINLQRGNNRTVLTFPGTLFPSSIMPRLEQAGALHRVQPPANNNGCTPK